MLDSSFCIRLIRKRPEDLRQRFNEEAAMLCLSTVVLHELLFGAEKSARPAENRTEVERITSRIVVLPFDENAAAHSAEIRAALHRIGMTIGAMDTLIAGHARSLGLIVVTGNLREFKRVDGLRSEDW
ncbi:MAG: type II toxin-antitoxin system VapC family toxin [Rhizobiaceae bacterium]|nr:type II toxin-antitoxin system VapC family toxin [Rhizobiaceae bacterium]